MPTLYEAARAFLAAEHALKTARPEPTFHWRQIEQAYRQARRELEDALDRHASQNGDA